MSGRRLLPRVLLLTARELHGDDSSVPIEGAVGGDIFRGKPECGIIDRVYAHRGIITPPREVRQLGARTRRHRCLGLHLAIRGIGTQSSRGSYAREGIGSIRDAITEGDVAALVGGDTSHPSGDVIGGAKVPC